MRAISVDKLTSEARGALLDQGMEYAQENELSHVGALYELHGMDGWDLARYCDCAACQNFKTTGGEPSGVELAYKIRNHIIAGHAPYWALDGGLDSVTAADVRAEVGPVLNEIIHACSDVIGDGFYPGRES